MATRDVRVDLDLKQNELLNFAIHNVEDRTLIENPVDGQTVHESNGKVFVYHIPEEGEGYWQEQANKEYVDSQISDLGNEKLDKIEEANKVYGTDENGEQVAYDVDSFGKVDDVKVGNVSVVTDKIANLGTMAGEAKETYVPRTLQGTNGKAIIFNETDGGGAKFEHNDGLESFVGVNDGGENGLAAQIYADKLVNGKWQGAKLDVTNGGMYYTVGSESFANRAVAANEIATKGNLANAISAEATARQEADNTKVDKQIQGSNGKALIFNESDGGGAKFEHSDGTWSFVGVNDGGANGLAGQIYAVTPVSGGTANGTRIDITKSAMYYTVGNQSAAQRMVADNEIATKGNLAAVKSELEEEISEKDSLPERTLETVGKVLSNDGEDAIWVDQPVLIKQQVAEQGYSSTYYMEDYLGNQLGAKINIPLDMVVESGTVEVCTEDDVPVEGYRVGDKYIDLVLANTAQNHLYILVNDLIDVYTAGNGLDLVDNEFSVDTTDTTIVDVVPTLNSVKFVQSGGVKAELNKKTDKELTSANGKALIFNETDGGGAKFEHTDGTWSFVGVNDGGANGLAGQIYAVTPVDGGTANGTRIDITKSAMYYTVGNKSFAERTVAANEIATKGDVSAEATARQEADNTKVDKEIQGTNGKAIIFNEADGGGAKFEHTDGTESFVGVNDGGENGLVAQIYADKLVNGKWQGAKIDVTNGGIYYTVGNKSFAERAVAANEIATKGDLAAKKQVVLCPALTASGHKFTWTFNNTVGEDAVVTIREVNGTQNDVIANVDVTAQTITIKMNQTNDLQSISAGQFKAIVMG